MRGSVLGGYALSSCVATALLAGCGGSQPPISAPAAMQPSYGRAQKDSAQNAGRGTSTAALEFVYVTNHGSNNVSAYAINASTGALTQVQGSPFAADYGSYAVAIDPNGKYAYVANNGTVSGKPGNVSVFTINPSSGALTPVQGSPFEAGTNPIGVTIAGNGEFAYVADFNSANISIFAINPRTGALKQVKGSPHRLRPFPTAEAIDPVANFIYVTHTGFGNPYERPGHIAGYGINARTGALAKLKHTDLDTDFDPASAAIDPSGRFVYVTDYALQDISAYAITGKTGALTEVKGSPFHTGSDPDPVVVDPIGSFAYVAFDLGVAGYTITPTGGLAPIEGSPFAGGYLPDGAAIDPLGRFMYVTSTGPYAKVYAYTINPSDGALTQVSGSPYPAGEGPAGIATCEVVSGRCVPPKL